MDNTAIKDSSKDDWNQNGNDVAHFLLPDAKFDRVYNQLARYIHHIHQLFQLRKEVAAMAAAAEATAVAATAEETAMKVAMVKKGVVDDDCVVEEQKCCNNNNSPLLPMFAQKKPRERIAARVYK